MASNPAKKTSREDWHPADILAALRKAGWTLAALGELHGVGRATMSHTFTRSYPANEKRIAEAIGVPAWEIWPSRWNEDGTPKPRGHRALQFNAMERARNSKAAAAGGSLEKVA
ncbi:MAG: helix-turn-helix domain-containing protein [Pseudomonadota bacterium]